jgi:predicted DCC family thiol-disulfide oxidoreductase YuxK
MQAGRPIVIDPKIPGGTNSPYGLILFDGVCVLCSRGCRFVCDRDQRRYFRFPMQLLEGRVLAEQLGINPDHPDTFAFVANGQAFVKSEAALRIARELPFWQWTYVLHFVPSMMRDPIYDWIASNRYRWFGRRASCILPNSNLTWRGDRVRTSVMEATARIGVFRQPRAMQIAFQSTEHYEREYYEVYVHARSSR